jgi:hypothetical protein
MSPYEVVYGQLPPMDPLGIPRKSKHYDRYEEYFGDRKQELLRKRRLIHESLAKEQERVIRIRNEHTHNIPFKVGDFVLYRNHVGKKWDPQFVGPWQITKQYSPVTFELNIDGDAYVAHAKFLKPYKGAIPIEFEPEQVRRDEDADNVSSSDEEHEESDGNYLQPTASDIIPYRTDNYREGGADEITPIQEESDHEEENAELEDNRYIQATSTQAMERINPLRRAADRAKNLIAFRYRRRATPSSQQAETYNQRVIRNARRPQDHPVINVRNDGRNRPQRIRRPNTNTDYDYY